VMPLPDNMKDTAIQAAMEAGQAIMKVYRTPVEVISKSDGSPVTLADRQANQIILRHLATTRLPVISEETPAETFANRKQWEQVWMVDPLDGTREFLSGSGEFTVNIALIERGQPVLGIIYAPASGKLWTGMGGDPQTLKKTGEPGHGPIIGISRSHREPKTQALIHRIFEHYGGGKTRTVGSSLKFCELAEGLMNIYPRCTPIFEWDTAAGHAILRAAGGEVYSLEDYKPLVYNKENLQTPPFIAFDSPMESERFFSEFPLQVGI
jgi:3'(2'), 5'-bisphosphate nucleotidase